MVNVSLHEMAKCYTDQNIVFAEIFVQKERNRGADEVLCVTCFETKVVLRKRKQQKLSRNRNENRRC